VTEEFENQTCSGCRYWLMSPPDPNNLGAARPGVCRYGPPAVLGVATPTGLVTAVAYPTLPQEFPACAQFAPRVSLSVIEAGA
jgi:hypothetical protein